MEMEEEYLSKKQQIQELFKKFFNSRGYKPNSYFDKTVWFMKNDRDFQNILKMGNKARFETPGIEPNYMIEILEVLNENDDLANMNVSVSKFIDKISEKLIQLRRHKERSERQIELYNAHKNKNIIETKINYYKQRSNLKSLDLNDINSQELDEDTYRQLTGGNVEIFVNRVKSLSAGTYNFEGFLEMVSYKSQELKRYPKSINILNFKINEMNKHYKHGENQNSFPSIYFTIPFFNDNRDDFSGCSLNNLAMKISKNNTLLYNSCKLDFQYLFLNNLEAILDSSTNNCFIISYPLKVDGTKDMTIELDFLFELGDATMISILNRICLLFSLAINDSRTCDNSINFLLENYFQESLANMIKLILDRKPEVKGCDGCASCRVF